MSNHSEHLWRDLLRDEGYRQFPYKDTVGKLTIGIGRNLEDVGVSKEEAIFLARTDVDSIIKAIGPLSWFRALSARRKDVIIGIAYNVGIAGLLRFKKMIAALEDKDWVRAAAELIDSKAYRQHLEWGSERYKRYVEIIIHDSEKGMVGDS